MKQLALGVRLRADAIFESFHPAGNQELVAALCAGGSAPLWIWGARGAGKTHLLQAVCAAAGAGAAYLPASGPAAIPAAALAGFESCKLLCIDDVDAVAGDPVWEQALFRVFNAAADLGTRLVFAAASAPRVPAWRLGDWGSRAAACVVYQLRELDEPGRVQALKLHARQRGLDLPQETADYLLRRMPRDLRTLLAVLDGLDEASLVAQRRLTVPFIRASLEKPADTGS
jgi:DnaA family protein